MGQRTLISGLAILIGSITAYNLSPKRKEQNMSDSCLRFVEAIGLSALQNGSNFVFSPLSIRLALSLAAVGSKGETLKQFLSFLGSKDVDALNLTGSKLLGAVRSDTNQHGCHLEFVNGIWVDESTSLKEAFKKLAKDVYDAEAKPVDFVNKAREVEIELNAWAEKATNGLIKDLFPNASIDHLTKAVIANALYFRGLWSQKFDKTNTEEKIFHLLNGDMIRVPFMTSKRDQYISSYKEFKVLRLPYLKHQDNKSFSMLLYLPNKINGLESLISTTLSDPNFFNTHVPKREVEVRNLIIPKFKISSGFEASKVLKSLGLELPFSMKADFEDMVSDAELCVSSVHHKATIEVEEEGTTAAAATGSTFVLVCYTPPVDFIADHPFMFAIREDESGALLFVGHVANPSVVETLL